MPTLLRHDLIFFGILERSFKSIADLSSLRIAERLGPAPLWRYKRATAFLIRTGLIEPLDGPDVAWALLDWKVKRYRDDLKGTWMEKPYVAYEAELHKRRLLYQARGHKRTTAALSISSFRNSLRSVCRFLQLAHQAGCRSPEQIDQHITDRILATSPLMANQLASFVSFLNTHTKRFTKLRVVCLAGNLNIKKIVAGERFDALIASMLALQGRHSDRRCSLICLIALLYAQPTFRVVAFPLSGVRKIESGWQIRPSELWLDLPSELQPLMETWMQERCEDSIMEQTSRSKYLFPGAKVGQPFTVGGLRDRLRAFHVMPRQLYSAAIANLCRNGLKLDTVARQAYGLKRPTLIRYMAHFSPASGERARRLVAQSTKPRGRRK